MAWIDDVLDALFLFAEAYMALAVVPRVMVSALICLMPVAGWAVIGAIKVWHVPATPRPIVCVRCRALICSRVQHSDLHTAMHSDAHATPAGGAGMDSRAEAGRLAGSGAQARKAGFHLLAFRVRH